VRADLPPLLDAVVAKALEKSVEARWQTADELRRAMVAAAEESGLRASRDELAAKVGELLGDRLDQRQRALQDVANKSASAPDEAALHEVLVGTDPAALQRSASGVSARSHGGSDDHATVLQRRSLQPVDEPAPDGPTSVAPADDVTTRWADRSTGAVAAQTPAVPLRRRRTDAQPAPAAAPTPPARPSPLRFVLGVVAVVAASALAIVLLRRGHESDAAAPAASASEEAPVLTGPPLRLSIPPTVKPEVIKSEMAPFARWLGVALDRPVELTVADSYDDCGRRVATSRVDLALLPPLLYVQTSAREPRVRALALRLYQGSRGSDGYLLVGDKASIAGAAELRGRKLCLVDRESTTGYLLPRIWLRKAGLDPDKDVEIILSGDHLAALRDLDAGRCEAAAVYSGAYLSAREQGIRVGAMRLLTVTGYVPQDVVVAAPGLPEGDAKRVEELLIGFDPERDVGAASVGNVLGISGFARFDASEFALIRDAAADEKLLPDAAQR
jgi:phosphonate transport system substrate-binding protein